MLDKIIAFSIRNKPVIAALTLLLIIWGGYSLSRLPVDAVPDITNNQVQIITNAPTLAAQEVEQFVTYPIERHLANLPDLTEIRSISRFGLSVVTVVFDESVEVYFARQLINERLKEAVEEIPPGLGRPELAPVSTGLGEVYQYLIRPKPGAEGRYTAMDLRSMQDWIVARQLFGTEGVAEVNSFGGQLKQYEVAIDPDRLRAAGVSIPEILTALERNNENTGGAYIDKKPNAYFIRGLGLVKNLEDIGNIVIHNNGGIPLLVRHVASPRIGSGVRYGAMTYNGEEEVVGGIVMMLKGYNSADVVNRVKARLEMIRRALPSDVAIEPFLDRTTLVDHAISTVERNLVEGALIVIFVLVLFLGNLRAGLIVASAIPLSLLFAFGMMHVFGVSANLMSLGAIDFGLIVDGAVIMVEACMHRISTLRQRRLSAVEMDNAVFDASSKMRSSAAFGEIIILIVYIPILTLSGIEGKMFRPMAQTVGFAILGALILSMTYIPMMCAQFLPRRGGTRPGLADRMIRRFQRWYAPLLRLAIRFRRALVLGALALVGIAGLLFTRMGGEFLPQLQEGDYAFHCILPQGASLSQSIETSMHAERILRSFPEVKMVVGKTGSAEIPTDPMPPEATDLIIVLKDRSEWKTTKDYDELAQLMFEKLHVIPGIFFEINQPIQMRFNELMTGIRQDVAVKIFGENQDTLRLLAAQVAGIIAATEGTTEPQVERTAGLPQITIDYSRSQLAAYGLNIADVNRVIRAAFAGTSTGSVYENERRYELVVRLDSAFRNDITHVSGLLIPLSDGSQIPLHQVAKVEFREGPAQISREDARRRLVVGFNVRGRDAQSVVKDMQAKLSKLELPTGYFYTFGGTFQNLEQANARLRVAVPIALVLILSLLYFSFRSMSQALLIFSSIPLAAVGGVIALLLRDMPFSISAGVGFIALSGVAVLNGIVLIAAFNELQRAGIDDPTERVVRGTRQRLRPVLMTALVASLGFLPMAISNGAGAEVQKPLATVVVGGLITATLLTLFVLPALYIMTSGRSRRASRLPKVPGLIAAMLMLPCMAQAQDSTQASGFEDLFEIAVRNNLQLRSAELGLQRAGSLSRAHFNAPRTGFFAENEDLRPSDSRGILKIGIAQSLEWPGLYTARRELLRSQLAGYAHTLDLRTLELRRALQVSWHTLLYLQMRQQLFRSLDSFYSLSADVARKRVRAGESAGLDSLSANLRRLEVALQLRTVDDELQIEKNALRMLMNSDIPIPLAGKQLTRVEALIDVESATRSHPLLLMQEQLIHNSEAEMKIARRTALPEFSGRFFSQRLYGLSNPFSGFSVTVGVPLLGLRGQQARVKAARLEAALQQNQLQTQQLAFRTQIDQLRLRISRSLAQLVAYENGGLQQARDIQAAAQLAYTGGEIGFAEYAQFLNQAIDIRKAWLESLNQYNQDVIQLNFYLSRL